MNRIFLLTLAALALVSSILYDTSDTLCSEATGLTGVIQCFSLQRNYKKLIKDEPNEIRVLNGIRVLTSVTVVLMHNPLLTFSAHILFNGNGLEEVRLYAYRSKSVVVIFRMNFIKFVPKIKFSRVVVPIVFLLLFYLSRKLAYARD